MAVAARAYAALHGGKQVVNQHIGAIASMVLQHRRPEVMQSHHVPWNEEDDKRIKEILKLDS